MKKIFFIASCLMITSCVFANEMQIPLMSTKLDNNAVNHNRGDVVSFNNNEQNIENLLGDISFNADEYIKISGRIERTATLSNIEIEQSNISQEKANIITQRLRTLRNITSYGYFDRFNLYLYSKPKYSVDRTPVVVFDLTDDVNENAIRESKKKIKDYYELNYYNKVYTKWVLLNKKQKIKKQISVKVRVDKNGNILSAKLFKSSGNKAVDDAVVKMLKSCSPFYKNNMEDVSALDLMFEFNKHIDINNKVKANFAANTQKAYNGTLKVTLDKNGNIIQSDIYKSTQDNQLDSQMLSAIQKTGNLFETISFDEKYPFVKFIMFRQNFLDNKPISKIDYYSLGDESRASSLRILEFGSAVEYLVKKNWIPPNIEQKYSITALFIMNKAGKVTKASIIVSSNIKEADDMVIRAIQTAQLPSIPDDFNSEFIPVEMTFDYELDPNINPILKELYFSKDKK